MCLLQCISIRFSLFPNFSANIVFSFQVGRAIDNVVVLVDLAAAVIRENFEGVRLVIKREASALALNSSNTKIGVLSYTYDSAHVVNLTAIGDISGFNQIIDNIPSFEQSGIKEAIHIGKSMFTLKDSSTNAIRNIMVLLTDGLANHDQTSQITKNMTAGMDLLVVGVGPNINQTDLQLIAGKNKTFIAPTFDHLASENFRNQIMEGNSNFSMI